MTTIAYRDGVLAADTAMHRGTTRVDGITKIVRASDGLLAGAAGTAGYNGSFLAWAVDGRLRAEPPPVAKEDNDNYDTGLIFHPDGLVELFEPSGRFEARPAYFAIGSGRDAALGAMFSGADAVTAVKAAIAHDAWTSGGITVLRHEGEEGNA